MGDNRENSHDSRMWRVRAGKLALPRGAESLKGALDACLVKRPSKTRP